MNILITVHSYYPNHDGVQFVTQYLAEGLAKKNHKVTVVTNMYKDRTDLKNEIHNNVNIIRVDVGTKHTIHYGNKKKYIKLIKELSNNNDVMINVCTQCATTDFILNELDEIKIPKILYLHSIWDFKYKKENFISLKSLISKIWCNIRWKFYYWRNGNNFKKYDVITQLHEMDYANSFFKKKYSINSVIIENAAEKSFFEQEIDENIDLPKKYLLNVSNFLKRKNQLKCLNLFLNSNIPEDWELVLIGSRENNYSKLLEKRYMEYKKKNSKNNKKVHILYNVPRKNIYTYVKKASIYLMTSKWEAFPISLIECMASKVPFVSSDVGIVKFLSGGVTCNGDEEYLFWLNEFISNEEKRLAYGKMGFLEARQRFSIDEKVNQLEIIIKKSIRGEKNE